MGPARGRSPSYSRARVGEDIHLEESQLPASQVSLPARLRVSRSVPASLERVTFARWSVRAAIRRAAVARSRVIWTTILRRCERSWNIDARVREGPFVKVRPPVTSETRTRDRVRDG